MYPRTSIAKSYGHCVYLFEELQNCFPRSDTPFNTFASSVCSFQLLNILLTLNNTHVFYSTLSGCEMASLGGFDLDFPRLIILIFSCTIKPFECLLWRNVYSSSLIHFLVGLFVFSLLSFKSSLYTLDMSSLSHI